MKWFAISGSWRKQTPELERDLLEAVDGIIRSGDGIVSGGALGVDYIATDRMLQTQNWQNRLKIIIPTPLGIYKKHYFRRADEGVIMHEQAELLISQLAKIQGGGALVEMNYKVLNLRTYYARNTEIVKACDELLAFQVDDSGGVQDTIDKAVKFGKKVKLRKYYSKERND